MKNEVLIGDCAEVLKQFPDESIDAIVTDPPYGYSFMNLSWDRALPSLEALKECNRVLKAGAFGFFMCAPRMDVLWRMGQRLEEAGFRVDFSFIAWAQAQGFAKAQNTAKAIDKKLGAEPIKLGTKFDLLGHESKPGTIGDKHEGYQRPWNADPNAIAYYVTAPATDEAKMFDGAYSGFQPKPSLECILVVMKPLNTKSYTDQALKNSHGVTWLGDCKIPYTTDYDKKEATPHGPVIRNNFAPGQGIKGVETERPPLDGRFPANLLVSDNCLDRGIITKSVASEPNNEPSKANVYGWSKCNTLHKSGIHHNDSGDFSRYFSLDAWWQKKISELPEEQQKTFPFLITPKPSKSEKNKYIENKHPTVKPLKLMSYLITMGSREGDVILDPFAGSGTTLEACKLLNRVFIGIDKDPANKPLMEARGQLNDVTLETFQEA